jgi:hypothetical protein
MEDHDESRFRSELLVGRMAGWMIMMSRGIVQRFLLGGYLDMYLVAYSNIPLFLCIGVLSMRQMDSFVQRVIVAVRSILLCEE